MVTPDSEPPVVYRAAGCRWSRAGAGEERQRRGERRPGREAPKASEKGGNPKRPQPARWRAPGAAPRRPKCQQRRGGRGSARRRPGRARQGWAGGGWKSRRSGAARGRIGRRRGGGAERRRGSAAAAAAAAGSHLGRRRRRRRRWWTGGVTSPPRRRQRAAAASPQGWPRGKEEEVRLFVRKPRCQFWREGFRGNSAQPSPAHFMPAKLSQTKGKT